MMSIEKYTFLTIFLLLSLSLGGGIIFSKDDSSFFPNKWKWDLPKHFGNHYNIPIHNPMSEEAVSLGRMLFYEKILSRDTTLSCASCHQQKKAFTDGRKFSKGFHGQLSQRSAMSLVNLLWVDSFFWDGRALSLEEQALIPIQDTTEMNLTLEEVILRLEATEPYPKLFKKAFGQKKITIENIAKAIAQFERTLISANSRYDKIVKGEVIPTEQEQRAIELFMTHPIPEAGLRGANCGDCHGSHLTTLNTFHDNGLDATPFDAGRQNITKNSFDFGKMRVPSLRNIALTAPYMHDGRFKTLEEVLDHYNEHLQNSPNLDPLLMEASNEINGKTLKLTEQEKKDILVFLHLLTDEEFINNDTFSNPFLKN